ncbi:MAG: DoxX family protein [Oxalobacteraceae bacterium]
MQTTVSNSPSEDFGKLVLRSVLAVLILFHGISKVIGGAGFITGLVAKVGLPPAFGYLVYVGEVIAPLLVLFGIWARAGAAIIAINIIVALLLVHTKQLFDLADTGGWALELQGMYLSAAIAVALLGAGRYSIAGTHGKWN